MEPDLNKLKEIVAKATAKKSFYKIQKLGKMYFFCDVEENGTSVKRIVLYDHNREYVGKINVVKRTNNEYEVEGFYIENEDYWGIGLGYYLLQNMIDLIKQNDTEAKLLFVLPNSKIEPFDLYKKYHRQGFVFDNELEQQFKKIIDESSNDHEFFNQRKIKMTMKL